MGTVKRPLDEAAVVKEERSCAEPGAERETTVDQLDIS
jgi:hypothetical protein